MTRTRATQLVLATALVSLTLVAPGAGRSRLPDPPHPPLRLAVVEIRAPEDLLTMTRLGADVLGRFDAERLRVAATEEQIAALRASGLRVRVLEADFEATIRRRLGADGDSYHTLDEIASTLDRWRAERPDLIGPRVTIGWSWEGRPLWAVKISDHPVIDEDEPAVLFDALQHAREPVGMETLLYAMGELLRRYDSDPGVRALVDEREIWFVPVVNPDGYAFGGVGGLWRKNRRPNADGSHGVDLNRNYGCRWGASDAGSSPIPASQTYRGPAPFSEPETQAIRDFARAERFAAGMTLHAFGEVNLLPAEGSVLDSTHGRRHEEVAHDLERLAGYPHGRPHEILYPSNGRAQDWLVETLGMISIQPEIGTPADGFWPSEKRVRALAAKNLPAILHVARIAGPHPEAIGFSLRPVGAGAGSAAQAGARLNAGFVEPGETVEMILVLRNKGLAPARNVEIEVTTTVPDGRVLEGRAQAALIPAGSTIELTAAPIRFQVAAGAPPGQAIPVVVAATCAGGTAPSVVLELVPGRPALLFADHGDSGLRNWVADRGWGMTPIDHEAGGDLAFTDSPNGRYRAHANAVLALRPALDLRGVANPVLAYRERIATEPWHDRCFVEAWTPARGWEAVHVHPGGVEAISRRREVSLASYAGEPEVRLRFRLTANGEREADGWTVDDILVWGYATSDRVGAVAAARPEAVPVPPFPPGEDREPLEAAE